MLSFLKSNIKNSAATLLINSLTNKFKVKESPVILIGTHRSGTSLLVDLLQDLGLFIGNRLDDHHESIFFRDINENLLDIVHGDWDAPTNIKFLSEQRETKEATLKLIRNKLEHQGFLINYIGFTNIFKYQKIQHWGWKDPRTTVTWSVWNEIFPDAKLIFLVRNGIDVASSMMQREVNRLERIDHKYLSLRCTKLDRAFKLWEEYNQQFIDDIAQYPAATMHTLRYEDLLSSPKVEISNILKFIGIEIDDAQLEIVLKKIKTTSLNKFTNDPELLDFYQQVKDRPLMKQFEYDKLT